MDLVEFDEQNPLSADVDCLRLKLKTGADDTRGKLPCFEGSESDRSNTCSHTFSLISQ